MSRFQRLVTPWLWPSRSTEVSSWNHRLGRVIHWAFVVMAFIAVLGGVSLCAVAYRNHQNSVLEIRQWKNLHPQIAEEANSDRRQNTPTDDKGVTTQPDADPYAGLGVLDSEKPPLPGTNPFDQFDPPPPPGYTVDAQTGPWTRYQIYDAMRKADAAGDGKAVRALAAYLKSLDEEPVVDAAAPIEVPAAPETAVLGMIGGLAFLLIGRAIRYVLAAE